MNPFDYLKHILEPGGDRNLLDTPEFNKEYAKNIFVINRGLAQTMDTVLFAQEMNRLSVNNPEQHFAFCFNAIKKRKRWAKWCKKSDEVIGLEEVSQFYKISREKAAEYLKILKPDQVKQIIESFEPAYEKGKRK